MDLKRTISVQTRLFLLILVFTWILAFSFFFMQYTRQREYNVLSLDARLQAINARALALIEDADTARYAAVQHLVDRDSVRITVISKDGKVIFDTSGKGKFDNHQSRKEFQEAIAKGHGFTVRRISTADNQDYFYSATRGRNVIVRSAIPYSNSLAQLLRGTTVDNYVILAIALILTMVAWMATHMFSESVKRLRNFAHQAEFGDISGYDPNNFPNDELGETSRYIVNLYKELQHTAEERDKNLREAIFEQKEKNRIKNQLTNNINHELKTPVHIIQACMETMQNDGLAAEQRKELFDRAYANVQRLSALLSDLSLITRISDAPEQLQRGAVNLVEVVRNVAAEMSVFPEEKQMRIHIDLPEYAIIQGNSSLVESIFRNLMMNAFNYSGGRDVTISLLAEDADYYRIAFADNGVGVEEEHLPHLFERFYRVDAGRSRATGGTGLGLSIVRNAIAFHRGEVSVKNDNGLRFEFTLHK